MEQVFPFGLRHRELRGSTGTRLTLKARQTISLVTRDRLPDGRVTAIKERGNEANRLPLRGQMDDFEPAVPFGIRGGRQFFFQFFQVFGADMSV